MSATATKRYLKWPLEAALAHLLFGLCRLLGPARGSAFGGWLLRQIGPRLRRAATARDNLHAAFPDMDDARIAEIERGMWDNLGRVVAEYAHLAHFFDQPEGRFELDLSPAAERVLIPGAPLVAVSGHFGNWEVLGVMARLLGLQMGGIYREPNNPHVRALLKRARGPAADSLFPKNAEGARQALKHLRDGGFLGALIDQRFNKGAPVQFFGRRAMTAVAPAQMSIRMGGPLLVVLIERLDGPRFRIHIPDPILIPEDLPRAEAAVEMTRQATQIMEDWIRERPDQWLWIHNRWDGRDKS